jgi:DNA mismatch repair protein MutH
LSKGKELMDREQALVKIQELVGADLRPLADKYGVTVWKGDRINKGWAGHVIERHLGLALNSSRSPNFGSWELKVVPLKRGPKGVLVVKETMAITMIDPVEVAAKDFEDSHLFNKLRKMVVVSRVFESKAETSSVLHAAATFDLDNPIVYDRVKADYDLVRGTIRTKGFSSLTGKMGVLIQPRTKGAGHGSTSRAFYARTQFVAHILNIATLPFVPPVIPEET